MPTVSFDWDEAAAQLAGGVTNNDWQPFPGTAMSFTYAYRATSDEPARPPEVSEANWIVGGMPDGALNFSQFTAAQMGVMELALDLIESVANVTFNRVGTGTSGEDAYSNDAQLLLGNFDDGTLADQVAGVGYYYYWWFGSSPNDPGTTFIRAMKAFFDISDGYANAPSLANGGLWLYLHEVLHTISIDHPGQYDATDGGPITYDADAEYIEDSVQYTVMSYFSEQETGANYGAYAPMTLMLHDIAALQLTYGANTTTRTGASIYGFNSNTGLASFTFSDADDARVFTIWDAGGDDTLDFSGFTTNSVLDLREEHFSSGGLFSPGNSMVNNIAIARGVTIENAIGGSGADTLTGNGADNELTGNAGADTLDGGAGLDTAVFSVASSAASFTRSGAGWSVDADGVDTLTNMEYLAFSERTLALRPAEGSVDGAASDIVLRNATTGAIAVWQMTGASVSGATIVGASDASYEAVASGDFNGDGRYDILFRNPGGILAQWQFDGAAVTGAASYATDPAWALVGVGDFNGDYNDDILYRHGPTGLLAQWQMDGLGVSEVGVFAVSDTAWALAAIADFNGDGRDDFLWRHSSGALAQWSLDGLSATNLGVFALSDTAWNVVGTGDFNGDLREDIMWRHSSGVMALWHMDGTTVTSVGTFAVSDTAWNVSDFGDYNGDGRDDILWQGPDGTFALWTMDGFAVTSAGIIGNPGAGWGDI